MERKWNANGTQMERKWNANGTHLRTRFGRVPNAFSVRLFLSNTVHWLRSDPYLKLITQKSSEIVLKPRLRVDVLKQSRYVNKVWVNAHVLR